MGYNSRPIPRRFHPRCHSPSGTPYRASQRRCSVSPAPRAEVHDVWRGSVIIVPDKKEEATAYKLHKDLSLFGIHNDVLLLDYPSGTKDPADYLRMGKRSQLEKVLHTYI